MGRGVPDAFSHIDFATSLFVWLQDAVGTVHLQIYLVR